MLSGKFNRLVVLVSALALCSAVNAELSSLSDNELSDVDGAGLGLVFEDFVYNAEDTTANPLTFKISGIKSTSGEDVDITVSQLYIANEGSNYGDTLNGVNLGRLINPYEISLLDGNDIGVDNTAVLQFAAPTKVASSAGYDCLTGAAGGECSSRSSGVDGGVGERPDIGVKLNVAVGSKSPTNLNIHAKSAVFDGSYVRLWGDDANTQLVGEYRLNFYTPELSINTCDPAGQSCGNKISMQNFELELALGNQFQPMSIGVTAVADGAIPAGNFVYEIPAIDYQSMSNLEITDYYNNASFKSNFRIGQLEIGDPSAGGFNFGSSRVEGMLIQYLKVSSHDLAP